jgi:Myosin head (motor domain)
MRRRPRLWWSAYVAGTSVDVCFSVRGGGGCGCCCWRTLPRYAQRSSLFTHAPLASCVRAYSQSQQVAALLAVAPAEVAELLTTRSLTTRGETFVTRNDAAAAVYARDAVAKALYESLFLWVVRTVSASRA